jgi:hypothetical protein
MPASTTEKAASMPGNWRDPEIFGPLDASVAAEERREKEARPDCVKRKRRPDAVPTSSAPAHARRRYPATGPRPKVPISPAFAAAKEKATRAARDIRRKYGEGLSREEFIRLANAFRSAVVPRRRPGRRPKATITAAYLDWKVGMRGADLYRKHIPGWQGHNRYHRIGEQKELIDAIRSRYRRERSEHSRR